MTKSYELSPESVSITRDNELFYCVKDSELAASLISRGCPMLLYALELGERGLTVYVFMKSKEVEEIVSEYGGGTLVVNLRSYLKTHSEIEV